MCEELEEVLVVGREESAATPPSMNVDPPSLRSRAFVSPRYHDMVTLVTMYKIHAITMQITNLTITCDTLYNSRLAICNEQEQLLQTIATTIFCMFHDVSL